jgi:hypothetical protein
MTPEVTMALISTADEPADEPAGIPAAAKE